MQCLVRDCEGTATTRGLCPACRMYATRQIKAGKTTWAQLEHEGKCLPPHWRQAQGATARRRWFAASRKEQ
jgi:hypothetical protein